MENNGRYLKSAEFSDFCFAVYLILNKAGGVQVAWRQRHFPDSHKFSALGLGGRERSHFLSFYTVLHIVVYVISVLVSAITSYTYFCDGLAVYIFTLIFPVLNFSVITSTFHRVEIFCHCRIKNSPVHIC